MSFPMWTIRVKQIYNFICPYNNANFRTDNARMYGKCTDYARTNKVFRLSQERKPFTRICARETLRKITSDLKTLGKITLNYLPCFSLGSRGCLIGAGRSLSRSARGIWDQAKTFRLGPWEVLIALWHCSTEQNNSRKAFIGDEFSMLEYWHECWHCDHIEYQTKLFPPRTCHCVPLGWMRSLLLHNDFH